MARVTIVSSELPGVGYSGGIGMFVENWGRLLLDRRDRVCVLLAGLDGEHPNIDGSCLARAGAEISVLPHTEDVAPVWGPPLDFMRLSESIAAHLPEDSDIVYFQDWMAQGMHTVRRRRLLGSPACPVVLVLHGGSEWMRYGMQAYPADFTRDTVLAYAERYTAEHADFAVSPSSAQLHWRAERGWRLPNHERTLALGYPVATPPLDEPRTHSRTFRRLLYFGQLATSSGIEVFVEALNMLARDNALKGIEEVVLLGGDGKNRIGDPATIAGTVGALGVPCRVVTDLDAHDAREFVAACRSDSLVVVPSLVESLSYSVIHASLIPGLNLIAADVGGISEVLGEQGASQIFEPHPAPLASKLQGFLATGPRSADVLGRYDTEFANERWLALHARALEHGRRTFRRRGRRASVDVCVAHHNHGRFLPQLLDSLALQTSSSFSVTVVDDGSTDASSSAVFDDMSRLYASRGWTFARQSQESVGAARNQAARLGASDYLLFIDADDVASPLLIETLIAAAQRSDAECLACWALQFKGGGFPFDPASGELLVEILQMIKPPGGSLATGVISNPYGLPVSLISRRAFEAARGFTNDRWIGYEDYEFYVRLAALGVSMDVVPETLFFYRYLPDSMTQTIDHYRSQERVLRVYRGELMRVGMPELADAVCGLYWGPQPSLGGLLEASPHVAEESPNASQARQPSDSGGRGAERSGNGGTQVEVIPPPQGPSRLMSPSGWRVAELLASHHTWRVLAGALALKARSAVRPRGQGR
jgi:GT2 family glycosyltransferase/glycosyltransferase involved in cell wall biosynthesis